MSPSPDGVADEGPVDGAPGAPDGDELADGRYHFRLYVAGQTPKSIAAIANLTRLCATHLPDRHTIEVLDLAKNPELAAQDQVIAIPTLVRRLPPPLKRVIGTLTDPDKLLVGLEYSKVEK
jgi:circadian clock protein KaiB